MPAIPALTERSTVAPATACPESSDSTIQIFDSPPIFSGNGSTNKRAVRPDEVCDQRTACPDGSTGGAPVLTAVEVACGTLVAVATGRGVAVEATLVGDATGAAVAATLTAVGTLVGPAVALGLQA